MSAGADDTTDGALQDGARVAAPDPRTGVEAVGRVDGADGGSVRVEPIGPAYPPGPFECDRDAIEKLADPDGPVDDYESRKRSEWDITCMAMSGALGNLNDHTVELISNRIAEGHV